MIRTPLMPHQKRIVKFGAKVLELFHCFGMFSGFGTGKSLAALSLIQALRWKIILIVSTKTAIESTWPEQIKEHSNFYYSILTGSSKEKIKKLNYTIRRYRSMIDSRGNRPVMIFLVNFDGVKNIFHDLVSLKPDAMIVDELTKAKHGNAIRSKVLWALGKRIPRRIGMTGFPVTENLTDIYSQIKFLDQGESFGSSEAKFLHEHFEKKKGKYVPKEGAEKKIFDKIKEFCIMVPASVIKLPPNFRNDIGLEASEEQKKYLSELNDAFRSEFNKSRIRVTSIRALWIKAMQICNGFVRDRYGNIIVIDTPKDEALFEVLNKIGRKEKKLIWTTDIWTLKKLNHLSKRFGYSPITLYGDTKNAGLITNQFQNSNKYDSLIATIQKANESITLSKCRYGFYYSHLWSNDKTSNADARIARIGSEIHESIIYTRFFIKGSIEEVVMKCVDEKKSVIKHLKEYFA